MRSPEHPSTRPATRRITRLVAGLTATGTLLLMMAAQGAGVPGAREVDWLSQLAHQGDAGAQLQLGLAYRDGRYGLVPDQRTARYWLDAAARGGIAYAADAERQPAAPQPAARPQADQHPFNALIQRLDLPGLNALSAIWHTVEAGSPSSYSRDALLARALEGDALAEYQLGLRYRDGAWAVEPDAQQSLAWLQRSAAAGNRLAAQTLAENRHY